MISLFGKKTMISLVEKKTYDFIGWKKTPMISLVGKKQTYDFIGWGKKPMI